MKVPLLDLKPQYEQIRAEVEPAILDICKSQAFILGPKVQECEAAVAKYCGAAYGVGMSSGSDALIVALMAEDVGPGDEVITTPYTFFATVGAISRVGAKPTFVDIDPVTFNLDPAKLEAAVTPKTKAIIPVHLYGQMADMDAILAVAKAHKLAVIEDAAQAIGAEWKEQHTNNLSDYGCFSFFPSKNLGGFGDGGMVTTNDDAMAATLRALRMHGETSRYHHKLVGGNFRLDALQAVVLHVKLPHLDAWAEGRRQNAADIERRFLEHGGKTFEEGGIGFPREAPGRHHVYNQFVVRVARGRRDELKDRLTQLKVGCAIYYPVPLHLQECFANLGGKAGDFPVAEQAALETLALPVFPELTPSQKAFLAYHLAQFSKE